MDRVKLIGCEIYGHHGVTAAEREIGQKFRIDVELGLPLEDPGKSDKVEDTVDYRLVFKIVESVTRDRRYRLIEAMADDIAIGLLRQFDRIEEVCVRVKKPGAALGGILQHAEVEIVRGRDDARC